MPIYIYMIAALIISLAILISVAAEVCADNRRKENKNPKSSNDLVNEKLKLRIWELEARINGLHNRPECYLTTIKPEWLPIFMQIADISGSEIAFANRGRNNSGEIIIGKMGVYVRPSDRLKFQNTFRALVRWKKGPKPYIPIQEI